MGWEMVGPILGGLGQFAGGMRGLFSGGGGSYDNSTFMQNWKNWDMAWAREQFDRNEALQREFAQNGIRWRTEDAKAAGLHPLAALGAAGSMYSPSVTAGQTPAPDHKEYGGGPDLGSSIANMGQGLGRAISATQTPAEKIQTASQIIAEQQRLTQGDQQIKLNDINLQIAAAKLAVMQSPNPGIPTGASVQPMSPETQMLKTTTGGIITHPSKDASKAEDEFGAPLMAENLYRNRLIPMMGGQAPMEVTKEMQRQYPGATGAYWDILKWEWRPTYHPSGKGALQRYQAARRNWGGGSLPNDAPRTFYGE